VVNGALQIVTNLLEARNKKGLDQKRLADFEVNRMLSSNPSNSTPSLD